VSIVAGHIPGVGGALPSDEASAWDEASGGPVKLPVVVVAASGEAS
jgi:hypothetical protein